MKEQAVDKIVKTKKEIIAFLREREEWFINYGNPFEESRMVSFIERGLKRLHELDTTDDTLIEMYPDSNDELQFKVSEGV